MHSVPNVLKPIGFGLVIAWTGTPSRFVCAMISDLLVLGFDSSIGCFGVSEALSSVAALAR